MSAGITLSIEDLLANQAGFLLLQQIDLQFANCQLLTAN
jgi:hypothetical protein